MCYGMVEVILFIIGNEKLIKFVFKGFCKESFLENKVIEWLLNFEDLVKLVGCGMIWFD